LSAVLSGVAFLSAIASATAEAKTEALATAEAGIRTYTPVAYAFVFCHSRESGNPEKYRQNKSI